MPTGALLHSAIMRYTPTLLYVLRLSLYNKNFPTSSPTEIFSVRL